MKKILKDEDLKEKNKDLYELLNDFKEELKECNNKEEKHQLYLTYLDEFKQIVRELKEDDYIYKYSVDAINWIKTRLIELYTRYKLQDAKKKQVKKEIKDTTMTKNDQRYIFDKDKTLIQDSVDDKDIFNELYSYVLSLKELDLLEITNVDNDNLTLNFYAISNTPSPSPEVKLSIKNGLIYSDEDDPNEITYTLDEWKEFGNELIKDSKTINDNEIYVYKLDHDYFSENDDKLVEVKYWKERFPRLHIDSIKKIKNTPNSNWTVTFVGRFKDLKEAAESMGYDEDDIKDTIVIYDSKKIKGGK